LGILDAKEKINRITNWQSGFHHETTVKKHKTKKAPLFLEKLSSELTGTELELFLENLR